MWQEVLGHLHHESMQRADTTGRGRNVPGLKGDCAVFCTSESQTTEDRPGGNTLLQVGRGGLNKPILVLFSLI